MRRGGLISFLAGLKRILSSLAGGRRNVSADYRHNPENPHLLRGWGAAAVAARQHEAFSPLIHSARKGNPRMDFKVAAMAIAATGEVNPLVLEIGCGSGYYSEILPLILGRPIQYVGLDYSHAMTSLARSVYPDAAFITGDALELPVATGSCDIALSGTSLMHIPNFRSAVSEMARVSRRWCLFHTVPVMERGQTMLLSKLAYGERVPEIIFNRAQLEELFAENRLSISMVNESFPYDLTSVVGEKTTTLTYLCEKGAVD